MYEKKQGKKSVWYPFIRELDRQRGRGQLAVESPLLWSDQELAYLTGSPTKVVLFFLTENSPSNEYNIITAVYCWSLFSWLLFEVICRFLLLRLKLKRELRALRESITSWIQCGLWQAPYFRYFSYCEGDFVVLCVIKKNTLICIFIFHPLHCSNTLMTYLQKLSPLRSLNRHLLRFNPVLFICR